jgi:hypothetical protein
MSSNKVFSRSAAIAVVVVLIGGAIVVPRFISGATHEAQGTITYINPQELTLSIEVVDPANGTTREYTAVVPADCAITINGRPAQFADLRVDDTIHARARIERGDRGPDGKQKNRLMAKRIDVTRSEEESP